MNKKGLRVSRKHRKRQRKMKAKLKSMLAQKKRTTA